MVKRRRRRGRGVRADGRSDRAEQFAMVKYEMIRREVFQSMSGAAKSALFEMWSRHWGGNNGDISLSYDEAASLFRISKSTAGRAFRELEERGFAYRTKPGQWYGRLAATWRLTMLPANNNPATNDYRRWQPGKSLAPDREGAGDWQADATESNSKNGTAAARKPTDGAA